ncbi:MAG TPA: Na+/H+ antiporter subunit G [Bacteroidales bacterium]|nr:Na+/H+ antiporter subunit G [Bacteroidales bacterium]HBZ20379.1 Na+/H+ antiporter subunit G [Bacteroidales bacterium]
MNNMLSLIFITTGIIFNLLGCIGIIRLPDTYNRLQAATKCVTLGCCSILFGVVLHFGLNDAGAKALVAIPILFFGSTVAAHALIRGTYHFGIKLGKKSVKDDYKEAIK